MTYQDQLIQQHLKRFELAAIKQFDKPSIKASQELAKARHELVAFMKECRKNAE